MHLIALYPRISNLHLTPRSLQHHVSLFLSTRFLLYEDFPAGSGYTLCPVEE